MLDTMGRDDRLHLLRCVCGLAWADGVIHDAERAFVARLVGRLPLAADERRMVESWLDRPLHPAEMDPTRIRPDHRRAFLALAREMIEADGQIDSEEQERLELLEQLFG
jgi:uncharacterized tellurite resistance protein B-like protein